MKHDVKRTIIVGIGGTGRDAVLNAKLKLTRVHKKRLQNEGIEIKDGQDVIPEAIRFLVFDTTTPISLKGEDGLEVSLSPTEFQRLSVRDMAGMLKNRKSIKKWFPSKTPNRAVLDGAGQIRALGRVALHANSKDVTMAIDNAISDVNNYRVPRADKSLNVIDNDPTIVIVSSLSGGTGSGMFLEIAWLFRHNISLSSNSKIIGYFLLPDVFIGKPACDNVMPNCYGALKELDYFMTSTDFKKNKIEFGENSQLEVDMNPFNLIYTINNKNKNGIEYGEVHELTEFLGSALFVSTGALSKGETDVLDNLSTITQGQKKIFGKTAMYCSFGISEIIYNGEKIKNLVAYETALQLLLSYSSATAINPQIEASEFIDRELIREDGSRDDVIDFLHLIEVRSMQLPEFKKGASKRMNSIRQQYLNSVENQAVARCDTNKEDLISRVHTSINEYLRKWINQQSGPDFCIKFINSIYGSISHFRNLMNQERDEFSARVDRTASKYKAIIIDIESAEKRFFGSEKAIEEACRMFGDLAKEEVKCIIEIVRREKATEFFTNILNLLREWEVRINEINNHISTLLKSFNESIESIRSKTSGIQAFAIHLEDYIISRIDTGTIDVSDFLKYLEANLRGVNTWPDLRTEDIGHIVTNYCSEKPEAKKYINTDIETELKKLSESEKKTIIKDLDRMAVPLWQYDRGVVESTQMIYQFGVPNKDDTIMLSKEVQNNLEDLKYNPSIVSLNDPNRIIYFKVEAAIPAFAIKNVAQYKKEYSNIAAPFNYHIDRNWEEVLPDLFPESDDEDLIKYWAMGFIKDFGLIQKNGPSSYRIKSEQNGKAVEGYWIKIPERGRTAAMQAFLQQEELVDETKDKIEQQIRIFGEEKTRDIIKIHIQDLLSKSKSSTKEVKRQVELEINELDKFLKQFELQV